MKRSMWPWLVVAVVPACGAEIDLGGPRTQATAGSSAVSEDDTHLPSNDVASNAGSDSDPDLEPAPTNGGSGGTGGATNPMDAAGAGAVLGSAGASDVGTRAEGGSGSVDPLGRTGAFKLLVLSKTLEFTHDSIPACQRLLTTLGETPDDALPEGATPGSQFTVDIANEDLSDFTDDKLKDYGMLFWCNPTGSVFSAGGSNGTIGMAAIRKFIEAGGAWGGVHSATDFEKTNGFPWFTNILLGASFEHHDNDATPGTVKVEANYANHPVMRGVPLTWNTQDEWYYMSQDIRALPGFQVLASLATDQRPVVWTKELGTNSSGRMFYTNRGHNQAVYREPEFKKLVHNGILWATHRMN